MNKRINISKKGAKPNIAKALSCLMALLLLLSLYGCSKQETGSAVTSSNVIAEVEIPEPDESLSSSDTENIGEGSTVNLPSGMEDIESGTDVEVDGETVGETALTQEEIDALRANTSDGFQSNLDAYESIMETGSWDNGQGGTYTEVVGTPGDESWRKMTKAEAEAILAERPYDIVALAEASEEPFSARIDGTVFFDPYAYNERMEESAAEISVNSSTEINEDPELTKRLEEASGIHDGRYSGIPD